MKDALRKTHDGVILDLEVSAGAKGDEISGYNPWRRRIQVRLSQPAEKGRANENLVTFFSDLFNVPSTYVQIITGLSNSKKSLKIIGKNAEDILNILNEQ